MYTGTFPGYIVIGHTHTGRNGKRMEKYYCLHSFTDKHHLYVRAWGGGRI